MSGRERSGLVRAEEPSRRATFLTAGGAPDVLGHVAWPGSRDPPMSM